MSTPSHRPASEAPEVAALERELAVLVRHLDGFGRRSDVYAGVAAGRSGYLLLMTLAQIGPATLGLLAATLGLDASTVTRQVAALEVQGLVVREDDPQDRRRSIISASESGVALLQRVRERRVERVEELLASWPSRDLATLGRLLGRLNAAIAAAHSGRATAAQTAGPPPRSEESPE